MLLRPLIRIGCVLALAAGGCSDDSKSGAENSVASGGAATASGGASTGGVGTGGLMTGGVGTGGVGSGGLTTGGIAAGGRGGASATGGAENRGGASPSGGRASTVSGGSGGSSAGGASAGAPAAGTAGKAAAGGSGGSASLPNITLWIAGDSTVANGNTPCPVGWGAEFEALFDDRVTVKNSAVGGRSVRTWMYNVLTTKDDAGECELTRDANGEPTLQARWQAMLDSKSGMKTGDYLFVQFGINDGSPDCDRHVGIDAFKESYGVMAQAAQARGATAVFVTPLSMISCNGSTARGSRGDFVPATLDAAKDNGVPSLDLHADSVALYQSLGFCPIPGGDVTGSTTGPVGDFFCDDHTHLSRSGAVRIAKVIADAIRKQALPLASYLR
jgi:lysophospholipase L1-like esterase